MLKKIVCVTMTITSICLSQNNIVVIGLPKSGTHLIQKCLTLITKKNVIASNHRLYLDSEQLTNFNFNKNILQTHLLFSNYHEQILDKMQVKGFLITRDPRDQIISMINFFYNFPLDTKLMNFSPQNYLSLLELRTKKFDEIFYLLMNNFWETFSILWDVNYSNNKFDHTKLKVNDIKELYINLLSWANKPYIYHTTFEKLIGPKGGGQLDAQLTEIKNIYQHLELDINQKEFLKISNSLFGNTPTFRQGQIGSWKKYFKNEHKEVFKKIAGQLLIDLGYEKNLNW